MATSTIPGQAIEMRNVKDEKKTTETVVQEIAAPVKDEPVTVSWDGPDDPENPKNFSVGKKINITGVVCALTINVTFASSAPVLTVLKLKARFGIGSEVADLITTLFLFGYVLGPFLWGSGSEIIGRRSILIYSMSIYTILFIGQALATNIQTVLIVRFLSGVFASSPLVISGGVLADVWNAAGRGYAVTLFGGCVFLGPCLGPLIGGFVADSHLGWQWIYWIMMIFAGTCTFYAIICLPETYGPVLLTFKAKRLRREDPVNNGNMISDHEKLDSSARGLFTRTVVRPWVMLANEPILALVTVYMSVVYGILYALLEALPVIFIEKRGFTPTQQGILFLGIGIGSTLTTVVNVYLVSKVNKIIPKWKGFPPPEERLYAAMIGAVLLVISVFWLGWSGNYPSVPWYVPGLSTVLLGMAISMVFIAFVVFIVDTYLMLAATALASNTMLRSATGAAFPLFTVQMYHGMGVQWASTLIALICLLLAPIPFLFYKYGARIRERSKYAPCLDLKIAKQIAEEEANEMNEAKVSGGSEGTLEPTHVEAARSIRSRRSSRHSVNSVLLENIQQLTNTMSEVQFLLHEAVSSQAQSTEMQRELTDTIREFRSSMYSRQESTYSIGDPLPRPTSSSSTTDRYYAMPPIPELQNQPLHEAPIPTVHPATYDWSVQLGPIDLSQVVDLHGTALSFARMTKRGNQISPQVRGSKGGSSHVLIMSWKTEEEAQAFYKAWSEEPPVAYATLSVVPNF
ncbi:hypothetical protein D9757_010478 [Collybiopsis confluens]|uniref:Major facilitator superfamily (MFS) profile domain-containing protein n=1 Tax=Collybiopsis confluens TaxID=2823264 RepID=A0A8H5GYB4_9AGAR|nr:hypothetical protein D9757_011296 [Collybiopsis confluens]KAF5373531.1 hypothetical protein D9757_010478 [Collybiopsis confluens]